jgi:hypothetical protein
MNDKKIEKYISYFMDRMSEIKSLSTTSESLFRRILYFGLIDTLSKSVYPHKNNHARITSLVLRFGEWPNAQKVSTIHLLQLIRKIPDPDFEQLRNYGKQLLSTMALEVRECSIEKDPEYEDIRSKWPKSFSGDLPGGIRLDSLQHINLLYALRNSIIHEMRSLGKGFEIGKHSDPYYISLLNIESEQDAYESIELVYPTLFIEKISNNCINGVRSYLLANDLNPYDYFEQGTYWIPDLN